MTVLSIIDYLIAHLVLKISGLQYSVLQTQMRLFAVKVRREVRGNRIVTDSVTSWVRLNAVR